MPMSVNSVISKMSFRSTRGITAVEILVVALIITVLTLMLLPRASTTNQNPEEKQIIENLRQLADAAQLYFMKTGDDMVTFEQLVGPGKEIKEMSIVAGERYPIVIQRGQTEFTATGSTIPRKPAITYSQ